MSRIIFYKIYYAACKKNIKYLLSISEVDEAKGSITFELKAIVKSALQVSIDVDNIYKKRNSRPVFTINSYVLAEVGCWLGFVGAMLEATLVGFGVAKSDLQKENNKIA
jgi:hypothetical protein